MATKPTQMRLPPELLERIDGARGERTRTAFVIEAVGRMLARIEHRPPDARPIVLARRELPPLDLVAPTEDCAHDWKWKGWGNVCETCGAVKVKA